MRLKGACHVLCSEARISPTCMQCSLCICNQALLPHADTYLLPGSSKSRNPDGVSVRRPAQPPPLPDHLRPLQAPPVVDSMVEQLRASGLEADEERLRSAALVLLSRPFIVHQVASGVSQLGPPTY